MQWSRHDPHARELKERKDRIWKMINLCTGRVELQRFSRGPVLLPVCSEMGKKMGKAFLLLKESPLLEGRFRNLQSMEFNFILCFLLYPHFNKRAMKNKSSQVIAEQSRSRE